MKKSIFSIKRVLAVAAVLISCVFLCLIGVSADEDKNEITAITLNDAKTDISVELKLTGDYVSSHEGGRVYIFELLPHHSIAEINSLVPVATADVAEHASVRVPYISGKSNRLYSKFVAAELLSDGTYNILTGAKYIDNISIVAENTEPYPAATSKKGLNLGSFSDAQEAGVAHTVLNIAINEYMLGENGDNAISFLYNGRSYYLNKTKMALLDHRVRSYTEAGINVYFNIILTPPNENTHPNIMKFYYDGISPNATLYALNTQNEEAMNAFMGFMDYFCSKYTKPNHSNGFVPAIILGFEVNSNRIWNNAGPRDINSAVYSYCTAFRIAYTAMKSHYSNGRVYVSLGNNFAYAASDPSAAADEMQDYSAVMFLKIFNDAMKNSGNIDWGVSVNPYPSYPHITDFWNDSNASDDDTPHFITMKNIGKLTDYLRGEDFLYNGQPRSTIIGEFGISGDPSSESSLKMQAAAYAIAYYTADINEDIDAFIYNRYADTPAESQYYGLYSVDGVTKKPIFDVFSLIDTNESENVTAFVRDVVGNAVYAEYVGENVDYKKFHKRTLLEGSASENTNHLGGYDGFTLFKFAPKEPHGVYPSDGMEYIDVVEGMGDNGFVLYGQISGTPTIYKGVTSASFNKDAFNGTRFMTVRVMAKSPAEVSEMELMLKLLRRGNDGKDTVVYEGTTFVKTNEWQDVCFDIGSFLNEAGGEVSAVKILLRSEETAADGDYAIAIENIMLYRERGMPFIAWFFIILLIIAVLLVGAYGVLYLRAQMIRKKRREARRIREQQMRAQMMNQNRRQQNMMPPGYRPPQNPGQYRDDGRNPNNRG